MEHYTQHIIVHGDGITLDLMVKPETDFDDAFKAWDRDAEEYIMVAGWLVDEIEDGGRHDHDVGDVLARGVLRRDAAQCQLGVPAHGREEVAHVVRDRAEVLWTGLHALSIRGPRR